jgi:hypothetical protein
LKPLEVPPLLWIIKFVMALNVKQGGASFQPEIHHSLYINLEFQNLPRNSRLHFPAIQTVDNPTVQLPTFRSYKATIDGYSTVLAACL